MPSAASPRGEGGFPCPRWQGHCRCSCWERDCCCGCCLGRCSLPGTGASGGCWVPRHCCQSAGRRCFRSRERRAGLGRHGRCPESAEPTRSGTPARWSSRRPAPQQPGACTPSGPALARLRLRCRWWFGQPSRGAPSRSRAWTLRRKRRSRGRQGQFQEAPGPGTVGGLCRWSPWTATAARTPRPMAARTARAEADQRASRKACCGACRQAARGWCGCSRFQTPLQLEQRAPREAGEALRWAASRASCRLAPRSTTGWVCRLPTPQSAGQRPASRGRGYAAPAVPTACPSARHEATGRRRQPRCQRHPNRARPLPESGEAPRARLTANRWPLQAAATRLPAPPSATRKGAHSLRCGGSPPA
mmetsp:Transcript_2346/g.9181  ORF Transcript_2346/g.9181 Transcript_2346/m.9181 type:complete len:361 (+) Transcript_2346:1121-2203(+)